MKKRPAHAIDRYCRLAKITRSELARRASLSPGYLCDVVRGRCDLGARAARVLVAVSEGQLSLEELLMPAAA
jgi:DNA-binding transcriptional regulator YdaS (Cro superfamily)